MVNPSCLSSSNQDSRLKGVHPKGALWHLSFDPLFKFKNWVNAPGLRVNIANWHMCSCQAECKSALKPRLPISVWQRSRWKTECKWFSTLQALSNPPPHLPLDERRESAWWLYRACLKVFWTSGHLTRTDWEITLFSRALLIREMSHENEHMCMNCMLANI